MLTSHMRDAFGYDDYGNAPDLLAPCDKLALDNGDWIRADQNAVCKCGSINRHHPEVQGCLWLIRTCEGLVKL